MHYRRLGGTDLQVSEIALGTVEIGTEYGISVEDRPNRPTEAEAINLLHRALDLGINFIDTARAYGTSEEIIGKALRAHQERCIIATKCACTLEGHVPLEGKELAESIQKSVETSLGFLKLDSIDLLQLHNPSVEFVTLEEVLQVLEDLKQQGKIRYLGVSTYGEEAPLAAIRSGAYDTIQIPYSLLDQRMANRVLPAAHEADVGVIIRSALLKGALTSKGTHLPQSLRPLYEKAKEFQFLVRGRNQTLVQAALRFALSDFRVSTVLVGTGKIEHLEEAASVSDGHPLPPEDLSRVQRMGLQNVEMIDPRFWPIP